MICSRHYSYLYIYLSFQIVLGRRLLSNLLTTYLPTFLICLVSFSTNYYSAENFEVRKTLNFFGSFHHISPSPPTRPW